MSLADLGIEGGYEVSGRTLILDGDIVLYRPCCTFNEDSDWARRKIQGKVNELIDALMLAADCDTYILFLTTKFNVRDYYVDDYKANRADVERPINLKWAKEWAVSKLNSHFHRYLEADDLLGIYMTKHPDSVIWSLDKDLRQIPGKHLDDKTRLVVEVTEKGQIYQYTYMTDSDNPKEKKKIYFDGTLGLYFQMLTGDSTDWILGCGKRVTKVYKSGAKKGQEYIARVGVGPGAALKILDKATAGLESTDEVLAEAQQAVIDEYKKVHGQDWQKHLECQANLLFMVRKLDGEIIQRWTVDDRVELFDVSKGVYVNGINPKDTEDS